MTALARARRAIGTPFRMHGRDLAGLDCVGLVGVAWEIAVPGGYAMRSAPLDRIRTELARAGFVACDAARPGAVMLAAPGPGQLHLGISTGGGIVHADAILRRVIERAAPLPWPVPAAWICED